MMLPANFMSPTATAIAVSCLIPRPASTSAIGGPTAPSSRATINCPLQACRHYRELSKSFGNPVHCVRLSRDGLVYVCDRANDRIQIFNKDGTFVKEFQIEPQTLQNGYTSRTRRG